MQTSVNEQTVKCPQCGFDVKVTESLAAPMIAEIRQKYEQQARQQQQAMAAREQELNRQTLALQQQQADAAKQVADQVQAQLETERKQMVAQASERARQRVAEELAAKDARLLESESRAKDLDGKLRLSQAKELELLRKERLLADKQRDMDLDVEKRVQSGLEEARTSVRRQVEDELQLKVQDKDKAIHDLRRQIEDLNRKAEQGSQQAQGEVLEMHAEQQLRTRFPMDDIQPVPKGEFGGDLLQTVRDSTGQPCGSILWEFKRTKTWSDGWLAKLRGDQRTAGAELAVIVTQALPKDIAHFDHMEGIWVSSLGCTLPVAVSLRQALIELARVRRAGQGQETKVQQVYSYLTGPQFRHRVATIAEKFTDMRADLDDEKRFLQKKWAKREKQLELVLEASEGMYGDLQGIAGRSLEEIDALEPQMLLRDES